MLTISLPTSIGNYRSLLPTNPPAPVGTLLEHNLERWLDIVSQIAESVTPLNDYPCTSIVNSAVYCHMYCPVVLLRTLSNYFKETRLSNAVLEQSQLWTMLANKTLHHQPKPRNIFQSDSWSLLSRSTKNANQNTSTGKCWTLLPSRFFPTLTPIASISRSNTCRKWLCCLSKRTAAHVLQLVLLQLLAHVCSWVSQLLHVSKHQKKKQKRTPHLEELHGPPPQRPKAGPQPGLQLWTLTTEVQVLLTAPPQILIHAVLCAPCPMPGFGSDNRNSYAKLRVLFPRATRSESTCFFIFLLQQRGDLDSITGSHSRQNVQTAWFGFAHVLLHNQLCQG